ncbi:hypothetical protein H0H92_001225 [Tricholoma furcatifolium]|nr:hypothetical protein H0H92_001225 [Tricholoma furcatifolium]
MSQQLTFVDPDGFAIIQVDNTTDIQPAPVVNRPSIRITSVDTYGEGNLIIINLYHLPTGCSVRYKCSIVLHAPITFPAFLSRSGPPSGLWVPARYGQTLVK